MSHSDVRLVAQAVLKRSSQVGLADARLARYQRHLAFASRCFRPAPEKQFIFLVPPHESGQAAVWSASKRLSAELGRSAAQARAGMAIPFRSFAPRS